MKNSKKRFAALGLVIALLLAGTIVVCASSFPLTQKQESKQMGVEKGTAELEVQPEFLTDLSLLEYAKGSKAERLIGEVAVKKELTEAEISVYNATPAAIKELTYQEARTKQAELEQFLNAKRKETEEKQESFKKTSDLQGSALMDALMEIEREELNGISEAQSLYFAYMNYADVMAVGNDYLRLYYNRIYQMAKEIKYVNRGEAEFSDISAAAVAGAELSQLMLEGIAQELDGEDAYETVLHRLQLIDNFETCIGGGEWENLLSAAAIAQYQSEYLAGNAVEEVLRNVPQARW